MADTTTPIIPDYRITDAPSLPLAAGSKAVSGAVACIDVVAGAVKPQAAGNLNLIPIGRFEQTYDNSAGGSAYPVIVRLPEEIRIDYLANDTVHPVTTLFTEAYQLDNQTVSSSSNGGANAGAGRVWDIDANRGVGVVIPHAT